MPRYHSCWRAPCGPRPLRAGGAQPGSAAVRPGVPLSPPATV